MVEKFTGKIVKAIDHTNGKTFGLEFGDGNWYSGFGFCNVYGLSEGVDVEFDWNLNGVYRNIDVKTIKCINNTLETQPLVSVEPRPVSGTLETITTKSVDMNKIEAIKVGGLLISKVMANTGDDGAFGDRAIAVAKPIYKWLCE